MPIRKSLFFVTCLLAAIIVLVGNRPATAMPTGTFPLLHGVGVLGDSSVDEYRGTDNRGGAYADVTFNRVEQLVLSRDFNLGPWGDWPPPRRTGFAYNWARSGATTNSMIAQGQHTGLAQQVAAGEVTFALMEIGTNDFSPYPAADGMYEEIYNGQLAGGDLEAFIQEAVDNIMLAVDTVIDAGAQGMIVVSYPNWELDPYVHEHFPDAAKRDRVNQATDSVNEKLAAAAAARPGVILADQNSFAASMIGQVDENGFINVGGELIDFYNKDNEPHHARLGDSVGHAGTVMSGLIANNNYIEPLNQFFDAGIAPLSDAEILNNAGIGSGDTMNPRFLPIIINPVAESRSG